MRTAPYAANWFLAAVSGLFSWASARGLIPKEHANPARQIPRYREFARERFLTQDELARLGAALRTAPVDRYAVAAILVLLLTGARLNEILHARRDWLDAERGLLNLPDSKVGRRSLFLSAQALAVLQSLPRMHGNPYLFPGAVAGRPRKNLDRPWAFIKQAAELGNLRLHDLRHSFASVGAGGGLGLPVLGKLLATANPEQHSATAILAMTRHGRPLPRSARLFLLLWKVPSRRRRRHCGGARNEPAQKKPYDEKNETEKAWFWVVVSHMGGGKSDLKEIARLLRLGQAIPKIAQNFIADLLDPPPGGGEDFKLVLKSTDRQRKLEKELGKFQKKSSRLLPR